MSKFKFKQGLLRVLSPALEGLGYVYVGYYRRGEGLLPEGLGDPHYLFYEKTLPEIRMGCWIGIQLSQHAMPPFSKREFTVFLMRGPIPVEANVPWKALGTRLPQLLHFQFKVPLHMGQHGWWGSPPGTEESQQGPPLYLSGRRWWQFDTQEEFEAQLANVLEYLLKYALSWLEDPQSVLPWEE